MLSSSKTPKTAIKVAAILNEATGSGSSTLYYIHIILHTSSQAIYQLYNLFKLLWYIKYPRKRKLSVRGWKLKKGIYGPQNMLPKGISPEKPPENPPPLPGGGPLPGGPNFLSNLSIIVLNFGLFPYLDRFDGFWLTSWKACIVSGSWKSNSRHLNNIIC